MGTLGPEAGAVSLSVGKRKQKERDVRRRLGGFLSEAGVRGEGAGQEAARREGAAALASTDLGKGLPPLLRAGKGALLSLSVPQFSQVKIAE